MAVPKAPASTGSQVAATARDEGNCVVVPGIVPSPKPCGPLSHLNVSRPQMFAQPELRE